MDRRAGLVESIAFVSLALAAAGCGLIPGSGGAERRAAALEDRLEDFQHRYKTLVSRAATRIEEETESIDLRRYSLLVQLEVAPIARDIVYRIDDPLVALLDVWALCRQTQEFYASGAGAETFGDLAVHLAEAGRTLEEEIAAIARDALGEERYESARETVVAFSRENPAKAPFSRASIQRTLRDGAPEIDLGWFFDTSLAPLRAIGGLDQTALAVHEVARAADEMTAVVNEMPTRIRLQTQLLTYEITSQPRIETLIASTERASKSADRIAETAESLPERLRAEINAAFEELERVAPELERILGDLRNTLDAATGTTGGIGRASEALEGTLEEFRGVLADMGVRGEGSGPGPGPGPGTGSGPVPGPGSGPASASGSGTGSGSDSVEARGRPFDIEDYTRTADAIAHAADSLKGAIAELRATLTTLEETRAVESSAAEVEGVARTVTLLALALFAGCAAIVVAARVVSRRIARPAAPPAGKP